MINSLQSLRFIFAIMIFLHHYPVNGEGLFYAGGSCGVAFFMILSGFVMSAGYSEKVTQPNFERRSYFLKRLIRLYPLHLLCLLGFVSIHVLHYGISDYIKLLPNIFLIQSWIPVNSIYFSGNAVSWCLSDMLFFYGMFPLLINFLHSDKKKLKYWLYIALLFYLLFMILIPESYCHALLYISPVFRLVDFFIGMLTYRFYQKLVETKFAERIKTFPFITKSIIEVVVILVLIIAIMIVPHIEMRYYAAFLWWFIMPEIIVLFALFNKSGGVISKLLDTKIIVFVGGFSFTFYMIHQLAITILQAIFHKLNLEVMWQLKMLVVFILVLFASYLVYSYYEIPITKYLKRKLLWAK